MGVRPSLEGRPVVCENCRRCGGAVEEALWKAGTRKLGRVTELDGNDWSAAAARRLLLGASMVVDGRLNQLWWLNCCVAKWQLVLRLQR